MSKHIFGDEADTTSKSSENSLELIDAQNTLNSIIRSSIDLNNRMDSIYLKTSDRSHYVFSMHTLTSLFRHICVSLKLNFANGDLIALWHHECNWLYGRRMCDQVDYERYELVFEAVVKKNLSETLGLSILTDSEVCLSNLYETESGIVLAGNHTLHRDTSTDLYEPVNNWQHVERLLVNSLVEYNKEQQRIDFPLYENTIALVCRLCHTIPVLGGHCLLMADGGLVISTVNLVASLLGFSIVNFKSSQIVNRKSQNLHNQLKTKLIVACNRAGVRCEKLLLLFTEEEIVHNEFISYLTDFLVSEDIKHLFEDDETTILNSIRTQVVQSGVAFSKESAWELFVKNIRENIRIIVVLNDDRPRFQWFRYEYPSLFNNLTVVWIQQWTARELVSNALHHVDTFDWMSNTLKENVAHLLASMHLALRDHRPASTSQPHVNNISYTKFVDKFVELMQYKYDTIESSHKNVCRMLEHIQKQHNIAKKLMLQLEQENKVLEERVKSTAKMLQQIGQDMTMTEQQLKVHKIQTRKTVQLKKILPEYQTAHERNVFKTVAVVSNTKALVQNINMHSLQDLRSLQKPDVKIEEILAAIIIILKTPNADLTWQKGAKRQMANLDRFLEELQMFDEHELSEATISLLEDMVAKIDMPEMKDDVGNSNNSNAQQFPYMPALHTLYKWIKGVIKYNNLMLKRVKPLHAKVKEIDEEVKEADSKLASLNRKSEALQARLKDLAQNFEEATVDKKEQEERVSKMKSHLKTATELNQVIYSLGF
jgi:dynein heavy chain